MDIIAVHENVALVSTTEGLFSISDKCVGTHINQLSGGFVPIYKVDSCIDKEIKEELKNKLKLFMENKK